MKDKTKAELLEMIQYLEDQVQRYDSIMDYIRIKAKSNPDIEFTLRKVIRTAHAIKNLPKPCTPEYREIHGVPFEDKT